MHVDQRGHGDAWCPELQARADGGIQHPLGENNKHTRGYLDMNEAAPGTLLAVLWPESASVQRVPAVVDLDFLPDMGRMTR